MSFSLPLLEEKVKPHQVTALHLVSAFAFIGAGAIITIYNYTIPQYGVALLIGGFLLLTAVIAKNKWVISESVNFVVRLIELAIASALEIYSAIQYWKFPIVIFGALCLALLFAILWEKSGRKGLQVVVDDDGIHLPVTHRRRFIPWQEVDLVTLRYGTLSIECIENYLFQLAVADTELTAESIELYSAKHVEENKHKRVADWN